MVRELRVLGRGHKDGIAPGNERMKRRPDRGGRNGRDNMRGNK